MEPLIGAGGVSDSWLSQKSNVKKIFDAFRIAKPEYKVLAPVPLIQLSAAQMCSRQLWESAVTFLVREYKITTGEHAGQALRHTNVLNYLRSAMRICEDICKQRGARQSFWSCLDTGSLSDDAQWFKGLKKNVNRELFERAKVSGESIDGSAVPLYLEDLEALNRAYCKQGSSEAAGARAHRVHPRQIRLLLPPALPLTPHPHPAPRAKIRHRVVLARSGAHGGGRLAGGDQAAVGQALPMLVRPVAAAQGLAHQAGRLSSWAHALLVLVPKLGRFPRAARGAFARPGPA